MLDIGDSVRVKVLDIDRDRQRISLGLKQTQEDPWQRVLSEYGEGDSLDGTVTKVVQFGAFVQILPGVEGLVHISELAQHHVESPSEVVAPGDEVRVKILEIDESRRRLSLSVKRVEGQELPIKTAMEAAQAQVADGEAAEAAEVPTAEAAEAPAAETAEAPAAEPAEAPEAPEAEAPPIPDPPEEPPAPEAPPAAEAPPEPAPEPDAPTEPAEQTEQPEPEAAEGS